MMKYSNKIMSVEMSYIFKKFSMWIAKVFKFILRKLIKFERISRSFSFLNWNFEWKDILPTFYQRCINWNRLIQLRNDLSFQAIDHLFSFFKIWFRIIWFKTSCWNFLKTVCCYDPFFIENHEIFSFSNNNVDIHLKTNTFLRH